MSVLDAVDDGRLFSVAPDRTLAQRMSALSLANDVRIKRAVVKQDLKAGRRTLVDVLLVPPACCESAKVLEVLLAAPKYGRVKANQRLQRCRISPTKTVGGLTERQRVELASMVRA